MVKEPPPKYVMFKKSSKKIRVLTMFNNDCFEITCNISTNFNTKNMKN